MDQFTPEQLKKAMILDIREFGIITDRAVGGLIESVAKSFGLVSYIICTEAQKEVMALRSTKHPVLDTLVKEIDLGDHVIKIFKKGSGTPTMLMHYSPWGRHMVMTKKEFDERNN